MTALNPQSGCHFIIEQGLETSPNRKHLNSDNETHSSFSSAVLLDLVVRPLPNQSDTKVGGKAPIFILGSMATG